MSRLDSDGTVKHDCVLERIYIGKNSLTFVDPDLGFLGLDDSDIFEGVF